MRSSRPPRSTHCPRCGFAFAWNGRKCRHCPSPSRARRLWEQITHFPELVGSTKGIEQRALLAIASAVLRRANELLSVSSRSALNALEYDSEAFLRKWGRRATRPRQRMDPKSIAESAIRLVAHQLHGFGELDTTGVQSISFQIAAALGWNAFPLRDEEEELRDASDRRQKAIRMEEAAHCEIARDVLGYPEVKVTFDPSWRTSTAIAMIRGMYESHDFSAMPILADALQDAGCNEPEILEHCRAEKSHVRGCWSCSLVLGE